MSSQPSTEAARCSSTLPASGDFVDVLIPGRTHPLHVAVPSGCGSTTVQELRTAVLDQLHSEDPARGARHLRLIFRGKELKEAAATLASQSVQTGSVLHGMVSSVQPQSQQPESEAAAARRAAQQALVSAVGSLFGDDAAEGGAGDPVTAPAGARAQMSQNELMRLLHEETVRRRRRQAPGPQAADGGGPAEAAVPIIGPSPPVQEEAAETTDGGRVRVTTLADGADGRQRRRQDAEQRQEEAAAEAQEQFNRFKVSFVLSFIAGFLLGPVAFFLPFEKMEVVCTVLGFFTNVFCNFLWS